MEPRDDQLVTAAASWLRSRGRSSDPVRLLVGDVSPRRYLRVGSGDASAILACYPPDQIAVGERFEATTALLQAAGVPVPELLEWDPAAGFMLLEDAGPESVYDAVLAGADPRRFDEPVLAIAARIAALDHDVVAALNGRLDGTMLRRELRQSWDLVLEPSGLAGDGASAGELSNALLALCDHLDAAPPRPCHRDLMARNLLLSTGGDLTVIDHQDLRLGPPWYDLASWLNDTLYVDPDDEAQLLARAGVPPTELLDYHRAAAQRALKIAGTFSAFARRGFDRHLRLVPPSLAAAYRHLVRLPETAAIVGALAGKWRRAVHRAQSEGRR